jgi:hypothetical protein
MKIPTPVITLIVGVVLAASLLVSSMSAVSAKKAALAEASASATSGGGATPGAPVTPPAATPATGPASRPPAATGSAASTGAGPTATSGGFVIPPHANYAGKVQGDLGSVALVVHDSFAVAYFCNGSTQEAWFKGVPHDGKLTLTGTNGASLTANYALGHARGTVTVDGIAHVFSIIAVHRPSGLFQSIQVVRGATIKAGWIVLADGEQVGSLEPDAGTAHPTAHAAPKLDVSTLTARDDGVTLVVTPIDGETGSGF